MKCSGGVAAAAIVVLLGSAVTMLVAFAMFYLYIVFMPAQSTGAELPPGNTPQTFRMLGVAMSAVVLILSGVGATTGVGLLRLWRWARYSVITWGSFLMFIGGSVVAFILLIPFRVTPNTQPIPESVRVAIAIFYGLWVVVGLWFVLLFTRKKVVEQFRSPSSDNAAPIRPVSISVIGWFLILSGPSCLFCAFGHYPAVILGAIISGKTAVAIYVGYTVVNLLIGIGLLRCKTSAYWACVCVYLLGFVNMILLWVPGVWARYWTALNAVSPLYRQTDYRQVMAFTTIVTAVAVGIPFYFLLTRKTQFFKAQQLLASSPAAAAAQP